MAGRIMEFQRSIIASLLSPIGRHATGYQRFSFGNQLQTLNLKP